MADIETSEYEWGYRGNFGPVHPCSDEQRARREAALIHGDVMCRPIAAGEWEKVD